MADITVTAANVIPASGATVVRKTAGATITAGQVVYLDTTDASAAKLADTDAVATAVVYGIAVNNASDGQYIDICTAGNINVGGTLAVGEPYFLSTTAGGIAPFADIGAGDFTTFLGIATTASNLKLGICVGGVAQAA